MTVDDAYFDKPAFFRPEGEEQLGYHLLRQHDQPGIPIVGLVSTGGLQEAVDTPLGMITLETRFPNLERIFRVSGDDDIPNGGIGAVLYNGETSLKHIYTDEHSLSRSGFGR